jgi:hypothetical protein
VRDALVIVSYTQARAWLFNIPRAELVDTLDISVTTSEDRARWSDVSYVDIDVPRQRLFLCTNIGVMVYINGQEATGRGKNTKNTTRRIADVPNNSKHIQWEVFRCAPQQSRQRDEGRGPFEPVPVSLQRLEVNHRELEPESRSCGSLTHPV